MKVVAYDLYPDEKYAREVGISYVSLDGLYAQADMISLHVPLTDQTKNMIDAQSIAKMKEGTIIINTSRGQLIHTNALIEGLKSKKIAAAGLDFMKKKRGIFMKINRIKLSMMMSWPVYSRSIMSSLPHIRDFLPGKQCTILQRLPCKIYRILSMERHW